VENTLAFARRGATNSQLEAHRDDFLHSDFLRMDPTDQSELWRISLRIGASKNVDYGQFVGTIERKPSSRSLPRSGSARQYCRRLPIAVPITGLPEDVSVCWALRGLILSRLNRG